MSRSRRVALAREALPSVTAWVELLISSKEESGRLASDAVVTAASAAGIATVADLARAARDDIAHRLAAAQSAIPDAADAAKQHAAEIPVAPAPDVPPEPTDASSPYLPGHAQADREPTGASATSPATESRSELPYYPPAPEHRTPAQRLADALTALRPHERLAAVRFYLDGENVDSIATMFRVDRAAAVSLLESVTAVLAPIVGEHDLPDFTASAEALEIEVVTR
jgi:DNA-directed RNA polymerase specialized sigma24 family protein